MSKAKKTIVVFLSIMIVFGALFKSTTLAENDVSVLTRGSDTDTVENISKESLDAENTDGFNKFSSAISKESLNNKNRMDNEELKNDKKRVSSTDRVVSEKFINSIKKENSNDNVYADRVVKTENSVFSEGNLSFNQNDKTILKDGIGGFNQNNYLNKGAIDVSENMDNYLSKDTVNVSENFKNYLNKLGVMNLFSYNQINSEDKETGSFIKNIRVSKNDIYVGECFDFSIVFSVEDAEKLKSRYEFELSEDERISILSSSYSEQSVSLAKDGVEYGRATLGNNKVTIDFYKDRCRGYTDISGTVTFSVMAKFNDDIMNKPNVSVVENIGIGDKKVEIAVKSMNSPGGTEGKKREVPFFKSGRLDEDGNIVWGLVFNQNIDNQNNFICISHPVEVYDDVGEQMEILKDKSNFNISIHNEDALEPDYNELQKTGQLDEYRRYYDYLLQTGGDVSEIKNYMYVPMKKNESIYPHKIDFVEKKDGDINYLSIVANYGRDFSGNQYFENGNAEIGRVYFEIPKGVLCLDDILKWSSMYCNKDGAYFKDKSSMYVVIYPGFIEGKYITFSYKTTISEKHRKDKEFINKASVNYIDRGISLRKDEGGEQFSSSVVNKSASATIDFKVKKNHCRIFNYTLEDSIKKDVAYSVFGVYESYEDAKYGGESKIKYKITTGVNGYTSEFELENGKNYYIKQLSVPEQYEKNISIKNFEMKNKNSEEGSIVGFQNSKKVIELPRTGGNGSENIVASGILIQMLFMFVKKFIEII